MIKKKLYVSILGLLIISPLIGWAVPILEAFVPLASAFSMTDGGPPFSELILPLSGSLSLIFGLYGLIVYLSSNGRKIEALNPFCYFMILYSSFALLIWVIFFGSRLLPSLNVGIDFYIRFILLASPHVFWLVFLYFFINLSNKLKIINNYTVGIKDKYTATISGQTNVLNQNSFTKRILLLIPIFIIIALLYFVVINNPPLKNTKTSNQIGEKKDLILSVQWSTKEAREKVGILKNLPPSFDDWQSAIFYEKRKLTYKSKKTSFIIKKTHKFSIVPNKGKIVGISITLSPLYKDDVEGALQLANYWNKHFESKRLIQYVTPKWRDRTLNKARKIFLSSSNRLLGIGLGTWTDGDDYYAIGIERTIGDNHSDKSWVYGVSINIWDEL